MYVDQDDAPGETLLNGDPDTLIRPDLDAVLVKAQQQGMPQYFYAMSPNHPLLFYTILITYQNLLKTTDIMKQYVPYVSGMCKASKLCFDSAWIVSHARIMVEP